jgi:hypothetical protein
MHTYMIQGLILSTVQYNVCENGIIVLLFDPIQFVENEYSSSLWSVVYALRTMRTHCVDYKTLEYEYERTVGRTSNFISAASRLFRI